jgi:hypothetical protein
VAGLTDAQQGAEECGRNDFVAEPDRFRGYTLRMPMGRIGKVTHRPFLPKVRISGQSLQSFTDNTPRVPRNCDRLICSVELVVETAQFWPSADTVRTQREARTRTDMGYFRITA